MIQLPWWTIIIAVGVILFLVAIVARLTDKIRTLRRVIQQLEGIEEEEFPDTETGGSEGRD